MKIMNIIHEVLIILMLGSLCFDLCPDDEVDEDGGNGGMNWNEG